MLRTPFGFIAHGFPSMPPSHLDNLNTPSSWNEDTGLQFYGSVQLTRIQHNRAIIAETENTSLPDS